MTIPFRSLLLLALGLLPACRSGSHDVAHAPAPAEAPAAGATLPPPANAVQAEMRILEDAARDWVAAIASNRLGEIPGSIHRIHAARTATEQALEAGSYRPPRNSDRLDDFRSMDEAFHGELVKLLKASGAGDAPAAARQMGVILEGCVGCHATFRF